MDQRNSPVEGRTTLGVVTRGRDGRHVVSECDDGFLDVLGYDRSEVTGEPIDRFVAADFDVERLLDGEIGRFLGPRALLGSNDRRVETVATATRADDDTVTYQFVVDDADRDGSPGESPAERVLSAIDDLRDATDRTTVAKVVVDAVADLLGAPAWLYVADDALERRAGSQPTGDGPRETIPFGDGPLAQAFEAGVRRGVDDSDAVAAFGLDPARYAGLVGFPVEDHALLVVATDEDHVERFALVERLCSQAAEKYDRFAVFEDLEGTRRRLLGLMSTVPGTVYRSDCSPERRMTFVTHDVSDLTGYDRDTFLDGDVSWVDDVVHPADREGLFETMTARVESLEPYEATYRIVTKGGQERWIWDHGAGIFEDGKPVGLQGFMADVTERERHKQRLEVLNRVLRHNLRNNMNVIMGYAETLMDELAVDAHRAHANYIMEEAQELTELGDKARAIEQALDFEERAPDSIDVHETVQSKVEEFSTRYPVAGIRLELPERRLDGPPSIEYALDNILENAIVHNDNDEPTVEVFVYPTADENNDWTEVIVADDGPGIPDHEVQALLEGGETPLRHGSGLGLWLVNWIVKRSGGELQFDENDPRGSVVTMRFPR